MTTSLSDSVAFMAPAELAALTGRLRSAGQIRWLQEHGFRFTTTAAGRPVVLRAEVERHLLGSHRPKADAGPRLDLVR